MKDVSPRIERAAGILREKGFPAEASRLLDAVNCAYTTSSELIGELALAVRGARKSLGRRMPEEAGAILREAQHELESVSAALDALFILAAVVCLALGGFCFVGMLFIGKLAPTLLAMGVCGVAAAAGAIGLAARGTENFRLLAQWAGAAGVLAVAADVAHYYAFMAIPGNYYAWLVFGPYAAALGLVSWRAAWD